MIDFNKIFNIFENFENPENGNKDSEDLSLLVDFSEHPLFWIGGFHKMVSNQLFFSQYLIKDFKKLPKDLDKEKLKEIGTKIVFDRAWSYIKNIKLDNPFHIECLKLKANDEFIVSLHKTIDHFITLEEYEKCAFLKQIEDKIKEFSN